MNKKIISSLGSDAFYLTPSLCNSASMPCAKISQNLLKNESEGDLIAKVVWLNLSDYYMKFLKAHFLLFFCLQKISIYKAALCAENFEHSFLLVLLPFFLLSLLWHQKKKKSKL